MFSTYIAKILRWVFPAAVRLIAQEAANAKAALAALQQTGAITVRSGTPEPQAPTVPASAAQPVPLVSREEHMLGEVTRTFTTRWGDSLQLTLKAPSFREVQNVNMAVARNGLDEGRHAELLVLKALGPAADKAILDTLDGQSTRALVETVLALAFGEKASGDEKNAPAPPATQTAPGVTQTTGSNAASAPSSSSPNPASTSAK